jgi:hypothetical protein
MADSVRKTFEQLRQYVKWDLRALLEADHGGNYAVGLIVAVGAEALAKLLDRPKLSVLAGLFTKHGVPPEIAEDIAEALRNGVAHLYDTLYINVGGQSVELIVSWREREHLSVRRHPPGIYLNARTMAEDLRALFDELRDQLPPGGELPRRWTADIVHQVDGRHIPTWRGWLADAKEG